MRNRKMPLQFSPFEKCPCNSQDSSKNDTFSHFSKDKNCSGISRFRMNCSGIYLINSILYYVTNKLCNVLKVIMLWGGE